MDREQYSVHQLTVSDWMKIIQGGLQIAGVAVNVTAAEINDVLDLSAVGAVKKEKILPITVVAAATEQDTGWDLPATCVVLDCVLDITTKEDTGGTKTVDIGTDGSGSNDPNGFADAVSVAAAGIIRPGVALDGTDNWFATATRGVLLGTLVAGSAADDRGLYYEFPDGTSGGESITYTLGSDDFEELVANMIITYIEIV